ncbi:MAG: hypothetical protein CL991_04170 [Euryarchaeota archaeon]|nr:hypothetical protein [Euryarchaeota archaeon]
MNSMVDAKAAKSRAKPAAQSVPRGSSIPPHAHCRICQCPVDLKADPRVCKDQECIAELERRETSERRMRTWMLIFFGLFAFTFIGPILLRAVA